MPTTAAADHDPSNGYEAVATEFMRRRGRSRIGVGRVRTWARSLPPAASILDLGCGDGVPISQALIEEGFDVHGVDASPSLAAAFQRSFPKATIACEAVEDSRFFGRTFDAAVAVGLIFLLSPDAQRNLIRGVARALIPGGRLLFTSPAALCRWTDVLTGRPSISLGAEAYKSLLSDVRLALVGTHVDEGQNHYYEACKR